MKETFNKKWKSYLKETTIPGEEIQIYCDLDGVLVDFENGAVDYINLDLASPSDRVPSIFLKRLNKLQNKLQSLGRDQQVEISDLSRDPERRIQEVRRYMYMRLEDNFEFWQRLAWTPDGRGLWEYISKLDPQVKILTAPMQAQGSRDGKVAWVQQNLGRQYEVILEEDKWKHAAPNHLLIDDTFKKVKGWSEATGLVIHHINTEDTLTTLKDLFSERV